MLAGRECVLVRVFDFLEAPRLRRHMQMKRRREAECGIANVSTGSFSQCHLLMALSTRCLITPSASHTAGLHKPPPLASADTQARLFTSNNAFSPRTAQLRLPANAVGRKVWRAADVPRICSTATACGRVPFSLPIKKTSRAARGAAESASTRPRPNSKPCYGAVCVRHNIAAHLSTSAVDSTPEQPGLRP